MKKVIIPIILVLVLFAVNDSSYSQVGGNSTYAQAGSKARAEQTERAKHVLAKDDHPPSSTATFVEANVLMNVKADNHVAVFGISQEGETLADCSQKMEATIKTLTDEMKAVGITGDDLSVDFVNQHKIYGYQVKGDIAQEKLVGFELKKNVSVCYKTASLIEKLTLAAAKAQVYDLIKVDYILNDTGTVRDRLMDEATRIIKGKIARHEKLLGIKLQPPAQVYVERYAVHYPTQMYDSYQAYESEEFRPERQKYTVQAARKSRTFYYNGLDGDGFDTVVNPVIAQPVIQYTLYLKVKYEVEQPKPK